MEGLRDKHCMIKTSENSTEACTLLLYPHGKMIVIEKQQSKVDSKDYFPMQISKLS